MIRAVIFDLDGTLVKTALDFAGLRRRLGFPEGVGILEHVETLAEDERAAARGAVRAHEMECAATATWMPGAVELLEGLRLANLPWGIVTRNTRDAAALVLDQLVDYAYTLLAREDCAPKPDPEGALQLAETWGVRPAEVLFVGDFIYDLQAARAAGMPSCLYAPPFQPRPDLEGDADYVVRELLEVHKLVLG